MFESCRVHQQDQRLAADLRVCRFYFLIALSATVLFVDSTGKLDHFFMYAHGQFQPLRWFCFSRSAFTK